MARRFRTCVATFKMIKKGLWGMLLLGIFIYPVHAEEVFSLKLDSRPFSPGLCKRQQQGTSIRIKVAQHRNLVIQQIPGQYVPDNPREARSKDYTHFITLNDLSNAALTDGAIAFRGDRAIIFTQTEPAGMSRQTFVSTLPSAQQPIAIQTLNTFLRLRPIINAAIDTCRPYPPTVTYGTDDEIDRIEAGRLTYHAMISAYNENPTPQRPLYIHETGMSDGFFDPEAGRHAHVSYQALNPLSFYVPNKQTTSSN